MKKINWKIFNAALWVELVLCYVLPFRVIDDFEYKVGFPIPFLSVYHNATGGIGVNPLMSMHVNPLGLLVNGILLYLILLFAQKAYRKLKPLPVK